MKVRDAILAESEQVGCSGTENRQGNPSFFGILQDVKLKSLHSPTLLALTTDECGDSHSRQVELMLDAGVNFIQLRSKVLSAERLLAEVEEAAKAAEERGAVLIVNDCSLLAFRSMANGVHLGMEDGSPGRARELLGDSAIIGRTVHSLAEAHLVKEEGNCDYAGLGPYRTSQTKSDLAPVLSHAEIVEIRLCSIRSRSISSEVWGFQTST